MRTLKFRDFLFSISNSFFGSYFQYTTGYGVNSAKTDKGAGGEYSSKWMGRRLAPNLFLPSIL
jgi:hypothetical protein